MNFKKAASAALAAAMTMSAAAPTAIAAEVTATVGADVPAEPDATLGDQSTAEEPVAQGSSTVQKDHQSVKVYASANGSYVLRVPESINLHNTDKSDLGSGIYKNDTDCQITLRGDVRQDQKITVTVTNPTMQSEGCEDKPANVDVSSKTVWNRDDLFAGAAQDDGSYSEPTGTSTVYPVSAELTPGDWVGTATFNCTLSTDASAGGGSGSTGGGSGSDGGEDDLEKKNLIPAGAKYTVAATGEILTGDAATVKFPETPAKNDSYVDENYTYTYGDNGWGSVTVNDKTKAVYGPIRSKLCGQDITSLAGTFAGCTNLAEAPVIPSSVTNMAGAFSGCASLKTYTGSTDPDGDFSNYKIPDRTQNMMRTFENCTSLTKAPVIPAKVTYMMGAFMDCNSLAGALVCNANLSMCMKDLKGTQITAIEGSCSEQTKQALLATVNAGTDISRTVSGISPTSFIYDGQEHSPKFTWKSGYGALVQGKDYILSGDVTKTETGHYTLTIIGKGDYVGKVSFDWEIKRYDIAGAVKGLDENTFKSDGTEHTPNIQWNTGFENLVKDKDYTITGTPSASGAGEYTITITGIGNYKGETILNWKVEPISDISEISTAIAGLTTEHFNHDGQEHSPAINWNAGFENLAQGVDYEISGDTTKSACGDYTLTVTGIGKYKGIANFKWNIREPIPVNAVYTIAKTGEKLTGDGTSVYFPLKAASGDTYVDEDYTYTYNRPSGYVYGFDWSVVATDKTKTAYGSIRSYICDKSVTSLREAFKQCANMTEAPSIPDGVTDVGYAFYGCKSLVNAPVIPASVTNMGGTFWNCTSLTNAPVIPAGVTNMQYTFYFCTSLVNAPVIPDGVTDMSGTFYNCKSLAGTLICNANPTEYIDALKSSKITAIKGSCSEQTKQNLLATR